MKEASSKGISLDKINLILVRQYGKVYAYENSCPHLGIPLEWQKDKFLDDDHELIHCSTHGALFVIDSGECVFGPCQGKKLKKLDVVEENGNIYLQTVSS